MAIQTWNVRHSSQGGIETSEDPGPSFGFFDVVRKSDYDDMKDAFTKMLDQAVKLQKDLKSRNKEAGLNTLSFNQLYKESVALAESVLAKRTCTTHAIGECKHNTDEPMYQQAHDFLKRLGLRS